MHEFLNGIADAYAADRDLRHYTFVFPNVRSKRYFQEYLAGRLGVESREVAPLLLTLTELVEKGCGMTVASTDRLVFMLYRAYCNVLKGAMPESFSRFRYWGNMILKDFNDVDKYLAEPRELFKNTKDFKEIQSFYLTPDQEEIIRLYWRDDPYWKHALANKGPAEDEKFWNHMDSECETKKKFTQLWAILGELYDEFRRLLLESGECYSGMAYRKVAESLMLGQRLPFNPKAYVFIGFNRLSHSEHAIFMQLKRQGLAHFYWDYDPALMDYRGYNSAGRFIRTYVSEFPDAKDGVDLGVRPVSHDVDIVAVASEIAQTKVAASYLTGDNTALVLADSELLIPTVASIPANYNHINVTMGFPERFTTLSQLLSLLIAMQLHAVEDEREITFFHDDVIALLSHPAIKTTFPELSIALIEHMRRHHLYNLPQSVVSGKFEPIGPLFAGVSENAGAEEAAGYLLEIFSFMAEKGIINGIDKICYDDMVVVVERLRDHAREFNVKADRKTFFEMVQHTIEDRTLPLEGEAFDAMQVMGVLETRGLGFPNVVMLSMDDDTFPGKNPSYSFIPESLRRGFGLPTRDHLEVDAAYNFYRILSHAEKLTLIYDARCSGIRTGQPSRYITQLIYSQFPGVTVNQYLAEFPTPKTEHVQLIDPGEEVGKGVFSEQLRGFRDPKTFATHRLSASDLKDYIKCPLKFFLRKISDINPPEDIKEESGATEHGNVIHTVAERIYSRLPQPVTRKALDELINGTGPFADLIDRELTRAINIHFLHYPEKVDGLDNPQLENIPLDSKNRNYFEGLRLVLKAMFEKEVTPFTIIGTEMPVEINWKVDDDLTVNFKMIIDRVDKVINENGEEIIRIIDYKTGKDPVTLPSVESLFEIGNPQFRSAIFQVLVYCEAFIQKFPQTDPKLLRPMIYKTREIAENGMEPLTVGSGSRKDKLLDYAMVREDFQARLSDMFRDIFDEKKGIRRAADMKCCEYCNFKLMCN